MACAVGDYDGDNLNDLAVALDDGVRLFRNLGKGKFEDVTAESGLVARNKPTGITFVDYDHDGDLDLFLTGRRRSRIEMRRMCCGGITGTRHSRSGLRRPDWLVRERRLALS